MRYLSYFSSFLLAALLASVLLGCGGNHSTSTTVASSQDDSGFSVKLLSQSDPVPTKLVVKQAGDAVRVDILADSATNAKQVYLSLNYDAAAYSPTDAVVGDFLGADALKLSVLDRPGSVPIGLARIGLKSGVSGSGLIASVTFAKGACAAKRASAMAPSDPVNQVDDFLFCHPRGDPNEFAFTWTEKNCGDFNNDGIVDAADLEPVAAHYGEMNYPPIWGPGVSEVNITVLALIVAHYGNRLDGYVLAGSTDGTTFNDCDDPADPGHPLEIPRPTPVPDQRVVYHYGYARTDPSVTTFGIGGFCEADSSRGVRSAPASYAPEIQPPAPTGLTVESGQTVGEGNLNLSWDAVTWPGLVGYHIYRGTVSGGPYTNVHDTDAVTTTWQDTGLSPGTYYYVVTAFDANFESPYSNEASGEPWFPFQLLSAASDKTTYDSSETATFTATTDPPGAPGVAWSDNGAGGTWPGGQAGASVTYKVPATAKTITISATLGNTVTFKIISTTMTVKHAYFDCTTLPSVQHPDSPYYPFANYVADKKVIWLMFWATW